MPRLLLIDGDEWDVTLLAKFAKDAGIEVKVAGTARAGLSEAIAWLPDCVVCDLELPDIDGLWFARRLRTESGKAARVPLILLVPSDDLESHLQGLNVGADVFVSKPFRPEEVVAQVSALIGMAARLQRRWTLPPGGPQTGYVDAAPISDDAPLSVAPVAPPPRARPPAPSELRARAAPAPAAMAPTAAPGAPARAAPVRDATNPLPSSPPLDRPSSPAPPLVDAPPSSRLPVAIRGDLAQLSVATVLGMLEMERTSGLLKVANGAHVAEVELHDGHFLRGRLDGKPKDGLPIVREILRWRTGEYRFRPDAVKVGMARSQGIGMLLLEAVRLEDESKK